MGKKKDKSTITSNERVVIAALLMDMGVMIHKIMIRLDKCGELKSGEREAIKMNAVTSQAVICKIIRTTTDELREAADFSDGVKPSAVDRAIVMAKSQKMNKSKSTIEGEA